MGELESDVANSKDPLSSLELRTRVRRAGMTLIGVGYAMCAVTGLFVARAIIGALSPNQEFLAGAFFVAGLATALPGGALLNVVAQRERPDQTVAPNRQNQRVCRAIGTFALAAGTLCFLLGVAALALKIAGTDGALSWMTINVQFGVDAFLVTDGLALRRIAGHML